MRYAVIVGVLLAFRLAPGKRRMRSGAAAALAGAGADA
jgi:hypothetical protein